MSNGKLVRDKIPEIIKQAGKQPQIAILSDEAYVYELEKKLDEEVAEYHADRSLEELADILEVLIALSAVQGHTLEDLLFKRFSKRIERGGFDEKIFWFGND